MLSYDPGSDRATLWNPWGHEQTGGYITHRGILEVPLVEFARYWNRVVIEQLDERKQGLRRGPQGPV